MWLPVGPNPLRTSRTVSCVYVRICVCACVCVCALSPLPAAATMSAPYTIIPEADLVLGEEVGRGAFGIVRRATVRGRPVCAKVQCHTRTHTHPRMREVCRLSHQGLRLTLRCVCMCVCPQSLHVTENPALYCVEEGSAEHARVLADFQAEVCVCACV